jgi:hypothetical protein
MATFYLLPSRSVLEDALGELLGRLLPGLPQPADSWDVVVERLRTAGDWPDEVFLVPRDDLPEGEPVATSLIDTFGAEPGDGVVEIGSARGSKPRSWVITRADISSVKPSR